MVLGDPADHLSSAHHSAIATITSEDQSEGRYKAADDLRVLGGREALGHLDHFAEAVPSRKDHPGL